MSSSAVKAHLRRARESISSKDWKTAEEESKVVLGLDDKSYHANVFLGLACLNLGDFKQSESAYRSAIVIDHNQTLAWQGLTGLYEKIDDQDSLIEVLKQQAQLWNQKGDGLKLAETLSKLLSIPSKSQEQSISILSLFLPDSVYYPLLTAFSETTEVTDQSLVQVQDLIINSLRNIQGLIKSVKSQLSESVSKEISKRRTRLTSVPKTAAQTRAEVISELYPSSTLPRFLNLVLDHQAAEESDRRQAELELLDFYLELLQSLPHNLSIEEGEENVQSLRENVQQSVTSSTKEEERLDLQSSDCHQKQSSNKAWVRGKVEELARGRTILRIDHQPSWDIVLDWGQVLGPGQSKDPLNHLDTFTSISPDSPLSRLIVAFKKFNSTDSDESKEGEEEEEEEEEDNYEGMIEEIETCFESAQNHSILAHHLTASVYNDLKEWKKLIEVSQHGLSSLTSLEKKIGKELDQSRKVLSQHLAIGLTYHNPPANHLRATRILNHLLVTEPENCPVLVAKANVLQHAKQWEPAADLFARSLQVDSTEEFLNVTERLDVRSRRAWCLIELGKFQEALEIFEEVIKLLEELHQSDLVQDDLIAHSLAENWHRLGICKWSMSKSLLEESSGTDSEKLKQEAHSCFIKSIKYDTTLASSFTYLGLYYSEQGDHTRSSKCFQKAFELDATQDVAAQRLATEFAEEREWDLVEVISKKLITGGIFTEEESQDLNSGESLDYNPQRLSNYSKNAWAWRALGMVQLSKGRFQEALTTLKRAIRFSAEDGNVWMMLGLASKGTGRYVAALRAFIRARQLLKDTAQSKSDSSDAQTGWHIEFCIADVQRQLGLLEPSIVLLQHISTSQPDQIIVKTVLVETRFILAIERLRLGEFSQAESDLINCLDSVQEILESSKTRLETKAGWKIVGDVFSRFGQLNRTLPIKTLSLTAESQKDQNDQRLKAQLSFFINFAAKLNVDGCLERFDSVSCLETSAIGAENGSTGLFLLASAIAYKVRVMIQLSEFEAHKEDFHDEELAQAWSEFAISLGDLSRWLDSTSKAASLCDQSTSFKTIAGPKSTLAQAIKAMRTGLRIDPNNSNHWNTLGCLSFELSPRLSQHSLIRSIELNPKSYIAWANLGFFYLTHSALDLANEAFLRSQTVEPEWSLAWLGQALIAYLNHDHDESFRLAEHAYSLSLDSTNLIETYFATISLKRFFTDFAAYNNSSLVLQASKSLVQRNPLDSTILNLHSMILESLGEDLELCLSFLERSEGILEEVYEISESDDVEYRFMVTNMNLGRIRLIKGDYHGAIEAFETVENLRPRFGRSSSSKKDHISDLKKILIIRAQVGCGIGLSKHLLTKSIGNNNEKEEEEENRMKKLKEVLEEVEEDERLDESIGTLISSSIKSIIAKVLYARGCMIESQKILVETVKQMIEAVDHSEGTLDFELIGSLLSLLVMKEPDELITKRDEEFIKEQEKQDDLKSYSNEEVEEYRKTKVIERFYEQKNRLVPNLLKFIETEKDKKFHQESSGIKKTMNNEGEEQGEGEEDRSIRFENLFLKQFEDKRIIRGPMMTLIERILEVKTLRASEEDSVPIGVLEDLKRLMASMREEELKDKKDLSLDDGLMRSKIVDTGYGRNSKAKRLLTERANEEVGIKGLLCLPEQSDFLEKK
ncbi:hypothetical protein PPACK8108_LOCUS18613 [Phakopsora pachyrhizi]|uniref:TPR-like protein n=1 Tax=Phakopsora pachyrhizi TaxID=170000 RepID=A0AAV0BE57_PHAPC|nr:hypothetical protein PPACK8108_LOCUS18613 [Phakopsora pachyrhizi]